MVYEIQPWWMMFLLLAFSWMQHYGVHGAPPQVPCLFIFGDSLSDSGNNNQLETKAKANYPPYGIDYPGGTTGRFTNGRTMVDFLAELLGFDHHMPSFANSTNSDNSILLQGVNYASGSAGIDEITGRHLGQCISFSKQIKNHENILSRINKDNNNATQHLNQCLYFVSIGNNDYLNNYFKPEQYPESKKFSQEQFAGTLIEQYATQIKALYESGARKFILVGLGSIGCAPYSMGNGDRRACADDMNKATEVFNTKLREHVDRMNNELKDAKSIYINLSGMGGDPSIAGIKVLTEGCCKVREDGQCAPNEKPCDNRKEYAFWDSFHPTETANNLTVLRMFNALDPQTDSHPFDISHLVEFKIPTIPK